MKSAIVLGAGSWGTALAAMLSQRGLEVQFWGRDETLMREVAETRRNARYLPDLVLGKQVEPTHRLEALRPADLIVFVTPSKALRDVAQNLRAAGILRGGEVLLSCTKGVEMDTGNTMSAVLAEVFPAHQHAALSGPNHAEEIAQQMPSAAVVACAHHESAVALQSCFTLPWFRCYTT